MIGTIIVDHVESTLAERSLWRVAVGRDCSATGRSVGRIRRYFAKNVAKDALLFAFVW